MSGFARRRPGKTFPFRRACMRWRRQHRPDSRLKPEPEMRLSFTPDRTALYLFGQDEPSRPRSWLHRRLSISVGCSLGKHSSRKAQHARRNICWSIWRRILWNRRRCKRSDRRVQPINYAPATVYSGSGWREPRCGRRAPNPAIGAIFTVDTADDDGLDGDGILIEDDHLTGLRR